MPTPDYLLGAAATTTAETITNIFTRQKTLLRNAGCWDNIRPLLNGATGTAAAIAPPHLDPNSLNSMACSSAIEWLWRRSKIVYALHPDIVAELNTTHVGSYPGDVFRTIPHTNPLIVFATPIPATLPTGEHSEIYGIYVCGSSGLNGDPSRYYLSTDDDSMVGLSIMVLTRILDGNNRFVDWDITRFTIPLSERFTPDDVISGALANYRMEGAAFGQVTVESITEWLSTTVLLTLATLLYVTTEDADTVTPPRAGRARGGKRKKSRDRNKPTTLIRVGWRLGPALHKARQQTSSAINQGVGEGQPPHQRRCHFKTVWTGPGRATPKMVFIKPYMVRLDKLTKLNHRVIPVTKPRR